MESVLIKLLEERPKSRGSKISDNDLKRLAKLAEENIKIMEIVGCFNIKGEEVYWKTNCMGGSYQS
ncbi:hypothetical protein SJAV_00640 [Sulfurisphaera javensis]|uniref:Uncharacterized protein n=1 Tax=Sulfurisphaera javensis TaxID=2049879 RepID=A0AAT9GMK3_9CREN